MRGILAAALAGAVAMGIASGAQADSHVVKVGILIGFTGPIESLAPGLADGAELAMKEVSDSGKLLDGKVVESVRADSTCIDSSAATAAAERLITADRVAAIMGADCSGVTTAVANNVAIPNGVVMISPSATSPALTTIDDNGFFFRTVPSDARQGQVLADIVKGRGVSEVAISYTNNDYGKGLADSFGSAFEAGGGSVAMTAAHEDGKADYSAEVAALAASGAKTLMIFGYVDQGGKGVMQTALDLGAFDNFFGSDGMVGDSLIANVGEGTEGLVTTLPGGDSPGAASFHVLAAEAGFDGSGPFVAESYDAAAIIALAMQAAGSTGRAALQSKVMEVTNAPGEKIGPGELAKGLEILAGGGDIDYVGATDVEFNEVGETNGSYKEQEIKGGQYVLVNIH